MTSLGAQDLWTEGQSYRLSIIKNEREEEE